MILNYQHGTGSGIQDKLLPYRFSYVQSTSSQKWWNWQDTTLIKAWVYYDLDNNGFDLRLAHQERLHIDLCLEMQTVQRYLTVQTLGVHLTVIGFSIMKLPEDQHSPLDLIMVKYSETITQIQDAISRLFHPHILQARALEK